MKKVKIVLLLGLVLTFLTSAKISPPPAKSSTLVIKGYVFKDDKKIDNAVVKLYQNNRVVQKITSKKSKFQFILFGDMRYMVEIDYDGCVSERIQISTKEKTELNDQIRDASEIKEERQQPTTISSSLILVGLI